MMKFLNNVDLNSIKEIFGEEYIEMINENIDVIDKNVKIMYELNFDDVEGIFERCPEVFMYNPSEFETKIKDLIEKLGENYVDRIEEDISYIENL